MAGTGLGAYVSITNYGCDDAHIIWDIIKSYSPRRSYGNGGSSDMSAVRELLRSPVNTEGLEIINEEQLKENENGNKVV